MPRWWALLAAFVSGALGCGDSGSGARDAAVDADLHIDPTCTTARVTHYTVTARGWCEFPRDLPVLPDFVRQGLTTAIAEPWSGGSYDGPVGQACGECWQLESSWASAVVMVTDLCPIQGNPICSGSYFHFDLAAEAADALQVAGLDVVSARRVPCPVTGNIHVVVNDWNEWGYMRVAFVNHRMPIRRAWVAAESGDDWRPFERSGGAWQVADSPRPDETGGVRFRFESVLGEVVQGDRVVPFHLGVSAQEPAVEDTGVQFEQVPGESGRCEYHPPGLVYGDQYGGIDQVQWRPDPWGGVEVEEVRDGCHAGRSCLALRNLGGWAGVHFFYAPGFPGDQFVRLVLWGRTESGEITVRLGPSYQGDLCAEREVTFDASWQEVTVEMAGACAQTPKLTSVTLSSGDEPATLLLDDVEFQE